MTHGSPFDNDEISSDAGTVLIAVAAPEAALSKTQKRFNQLGMEIADTRRRLAGWLAFVPLFQRRVATEYEPLQRRWRERRVEMTGLLARALDADVLSKWQRRTARALLLDLASGLLDEARDPELEQLYERYGRSSFEDERRAETEVMQLFAGEVFGVDFGSDELADGPDDLMRMIGEKLESAEPSGDCSLPTGLQRKRRRPSAKQAARAALREQAQADASLALRDIYRKLVSQLHPDREPDPEERARKTQLIQRVNQAYEARNLLELLELQLSAEQIDIATLGGLADQRLQHYNLVLEEQLARLRRQLSAEIRPFEAMVRVGLDKHDGPERVLRALERDVRALQCQLQSMETDLEAFQDLRLLKQALNRLRQQFDYDDFDNPAVEPTIIVRRR